MRLKDLRIGDKVWTVLKKGHWVKCDHCKNQRWTQTGYRVSVGKVFELSFFDGNFVVNKFCGTINHHASREAAEKECAKLNRRFKRKGY